jgi:hypothetical protein
MRTRHFPSIHEAAPVETLEKLSNSHNAPSGTAKRHLKITEFACFEEANETEIEVGHSSGPENEIE